MRQTPKRIGRPREAVKPYSVLDGGNEGKRPAARRSRQNEPDAPNPVPLIPLRFEDDYDDESFIDNEQP